MRYAEGVLEAELDEDLRSELGLAEVYARREFFVTSGFREGDERTHGAAIGADIRCRDSSNRWRMVAGLFRTSGIVRIGLYSHHIHVDMGEDISGYPQEVLWLGGASK